MRPGIRSAIEKHTASALTSFLDELANGTRNYRSLHNLTEQIEHQYHGRFLVELLQNAHDCLRADRSTPGRIAVHFEESEGEFGTLYVANDGRAFTPDDFADLSRLGQSSKDPNRFVGNKGIGFRSVLEICSAPEVVSRSARASGKFDGYCFAFRPAFVDAFSKALAGAVTNRESPTAELGSGKVVLTSGWTQARLETFWKTWAKPGLLDKECRFLSPYLLPIPLGEPVERVSALESEGYATVIRLLLKDDSARGTVKKTIASFEVGDLLFLESAREVTVSTSDGTITHRRHSRKVKDALAIRGVAWEKVSLLTLAPSASTSETPRLEYWLWTRVIGGEADAKGAADLAKAAANLPGKWPDVHEASVSLAVRLGALPAEGRFSIFLPTQQETGSSLHINAPFFGEMSRASIPFEEPFNRLLLDHAAAIALQLLRNLRGEANEYGTACADLIGIRGEAEQSIYWQALKRQASASKADLAKLASIQTSRGWRSLAESAPIPKLLAPKALTEAFMARVAPHAHPVPALASRIDYLDRTHRELLGSQFAADESQKADLVEAAIKALTEEGDLPAETWEMIWGDASRLVPANDYAAHPLLGRKVLLSGGRLVARKKDGQGKTVFTLPLEDEPTDGDKGVRNVPETLRRRMGFLDETIPTVKIVDGKRAKSPVRDYLLRGNPPLVEDFRRRTVFSAFLRPLAAGAGRVALDAPEAALMRDILHWGIRLIETARGRETLTDQLSELRVPCRGGWFPVAEAIFGSGWVPKADPGVDVEALLAQEADGLARLVLPPDDAAWGTNALPWKEVLMEAGLARGLRLKTVEAANWSSGIDLSRTQITLSGTSPPGIHGDLWKRYSAAVISPLRAPYERQHRYQIDGLWVPYGFERWIELSSDQREALARVLFVSLGEWPESWTGARADKQAGEAQTQRFASPLRFALETEPWITFQRDGEYKSFRPRDLTFIPSAKLSDGRWRFSHLDHLPMELVRLVEGLPGVFDMLRRLGIIDYPSDETSPDVRFLNSLAVAISSGRVGPEQRDVFLGQVYAGWSAFDPGDSNAFPDAVVCQKGSELTLLNREDSEIAYLPDVRSELADLLRREEKAVVHIQAPVARRHREAFAKAFGERIRPLSGVSLVPLMDGAPWRPEGLELALQDGELWWLPIVVLATASYAGSSSWGTHAKSFGVGLDTLRRAKFRRTAAITLRGSYGDDVLVDRPVGAVWVGDEEVLLIDPSATTYWQDLAEAVGDILDRADLESSLRLVFAPIARAGEVDDAVLTSALREVRINPSQVSEVRKTWLGDVSWLVQRIRPAIRLLTPQADLSQLEDAVSKDQLEAALRAYCDHPAVATSDLLSFAQSARNDEEMGRWMHDKLGDAAERAAWNAILDALGLPYRRLKNLEAEKEFRSYLVECRNAYCAVLRFLGRTNANPSQLYFQALAKYDSMALPDRLAWNTWNVAFSDAMQPVAALLKEINANEPHIRAFAEASNLQQLLQGLAAHGLDPATDPAELFRRNVELCKQQRALLRRCGVLLAQNAAADALTWSRLSESDGERIAASLRDGLGYLRELSFTALIDTAIASLPAGTVRDQLQDRLRGVQDADGILRALNLTAADVEKVDDLLRRAQEDIVRQRRQIRICGADFDSDESNFGNLLQHLEKLLPDGQTPGIELSSFENLAAVRRRRGGVSTTAATGRPGRGGPIRRLTSQERDVIGLVGEILVWRALKQKLAMSAANWLSTNARHVFPDSRGDDAIGCDFRIRVATSTYEIEVKATSGEEPEFELGPSEVALAASRRRGRRERFVIAHVIRALSTQPSIRLLPNPYDPLHEKNFLFRADGGFTVIYRPEMSIDDL